MPGYCLIRGFEWRPAARISCVQRFEILFEIKFSSDSEKLRFVRQRPAPGELFQGLSIRSKSEIFQGLFR